MKIKFMKPWKNASTLGIKVLPPDVNESLGRFYGGGRTYYPVWAERH